MRTTASVKQSNFQDPTLHNGDFYKYCDRTLFPLPETLVGNQYLDVLRIFCPPQILVPLPIFAKFERHFLHSIE